MNMNTPLNNLKDAYKPQATQDKDGLMSSTDKKKLDGVAEGAEVNQNAFSNVTVGSTVIASDTKTDTLTLVGSNVTLTPDATNDKVTIGVTKANAFSALGVPASNGLATQSAYGLMSAADKKKLDGVAESATKIIVDSAMSDTSTNPVQNKIVNAAINTRASASIFKYKTVNTGSFTSQFRTAVNGSSAIGPFLSILRNDSNTDMTYGYASGLAFGEGDTHGWMNFNWNGPGVIVGGGSGDTLHWLKHLEFKEDAQSTYLPLSGGIMNGNLNFSATDGPYARSNGLCWSGSTDGAEIYYRVDAADAGRLVFNLLDDANTLFCFAKSGTDQVYIDGNTFTGYTKYLGINGIPADMNVALDNCRIMGTPSANSPYNGQWVIGDSYQHNGAWCIQRVNDFATNRKWYERHLSNGAWSSWYSDESVIFSYSTPDRPALWVY